MKEEHCCTCHPDDNPPIPCAKKYALSDCKKTMQSTITWHKYPDEMPPEDTRILLFGTNINIGLFMAETEDMNGGFWDEYEEEEFYKIKAWSYLPEKPIS